MDDALKPYQAQILRDLEDGLDEVAIAEMGEYWLYDGEALLERGKQHRHTVGFNEKREEVYRPADPRVDLVVEITSKGNLKVEWFPRGWRSFRFSDRDEDEGCDWQLWRESTHRSGAFDSRPSNELLFIRGISYSRHSINSRDDWHTERDCIINEILLRAAESLVEELKFRLGMTFDVRMITDVFSEWEEVPAARDWTSNDRLTSWEITNVIERQTECEKQRLRGLKMEFGFSLEVLIEQYEYASKKKRSGPPPQSHTQATRAAKSLREMGHDIHAGQVRDLLILAQKHRPELFASEV